MGETGLDNSIEPPLRTMQPNETQRQRESSRRLADSAAGRVEKQGFAGVEAGGEGIATLETAIGVGGDGQQIAVAVAGVSVCLGAQMLDHLDGQIELGVAVALEVLGADADGDVGAVGRLDRERDRLIAM